MDRMVYYIRKITSKIIPPGLDEMYLGYATSKGQESSDKIINLLNSKSPVLISRLGSAELAVIVNYIEKTTPKSKILRAIQFITLKTNYFDSYDEDIVKGLCNNAGFFSSDISRLDDFSSLYLNNVKDIDLLASWRLFENKIPNLPSNRILLSDLEPHRHQRPWTIALKRKRILVVHPFKSSIEKQYQRRHLIYPGNENLLPDFELITYQSVQSIGGNAIDYTSWFDALNKMISDISKIEFDIALIGCGAYGLPLGYHIKSMGKKAIHIGGHLQYMFGISGSRWESHSSFNHLINEHWVKPSTEETPKQYKTIENGCYW